MKEDRIPATQTSEQNPSTVFTEYKDAGGHSGGGFPETRRQTEVWVICCLEGTGRL